MHRLEGGFCARLISRFRGLSREAAPHLDRTPQFAIAGLVEGEVAVRVHRSAPAGLYSATHPSIQLARVRIEVVAP